MPPPRFFQQASFILNSTSMLLSQAVSTQHNIFSTSITNLYLLCLDYRFIFSLFCMGNQEFLFRPGIRFWLRVFLILVESVPNFFLRVSKYIFFNYYIYIYIFFFFFSGQGVPRNTLVWTWRRHWLNLFLHVCGERKREKFLLFSYINTISFL